MCNWRSRAAPRFLLLLLSLLTACQRQNNVELTLVARGLNLETQISALRQTATVDVERLEVTLDYMATRVEFARRQRQELEATLGARGTPFPGSIGGPTGTPFPLPNNVNAAPTVAVATEAPLQLSGQAQFTDIVMAASVRDNDCATQPQFDFRADAERIYIVATAWNIRANTRDRGALRHLGTRIAAGVASGRADKRKLHLVLHRTERLALCRWQLERSPRNQWHSCQRLSDLQHSRPVMTVVEPCRSLT